MSEVKAIPEGFHSVTAYLSVEGAADAIEFYKKAFGATERMRLPTPEGKIAHAEIEIGDSIIMLTDAINEPVSSSIIYLYVDDTDATYARALDAGATSRMEPSDMFWGDRFGSVQDPFGIRWSIATHKEELAPEEITKRMTAAASS